MDYKLNERGERPWGFWQIDEIGDGFVKKTIVVNPGASLSLQSHEYRAEKWEIIEGTAEVTVDKITQIHQVGDVVEIPRKAVHRLRNVSITAILIVKETQLGDILDEDDIVRYDDIYGRCSIHNHNIHNNSGSHHNVNSEIFVADMDGTLTPARLPMTPEFAEFFERFISNHTFYIVSGSDIKKIEEQLPQNIRNKVAGIYASMGNELHIGGNIVYKNDFTPESSLFEKLEQYRKNTTYKCKLYPNYIEKRRGMINFSVLGRDCPYDVRTEYSNWDKKHREREKIANELSAIYPDYDISVGGNISIDIVPRGFGKDQVADRLCKEYGKDCRIVFFGDRTEKGGNDYSLACRLFELFENAQVIQVSGPDDVLKFLEKKEEKSYE